jgi:hypothetical protein
MLKTTKKTNQTCNRMILSKKEFGKTLNGKTLGYTRLWDAAQKNCKMRSNNSTERL